MPDKLHFWAHRCLTLQSRPIDVMKPSYQELNVCAIPQWHAMKYWSGFLLPYILGKDLLSYEPHTMPDLRERCFRLTFPCLDFNAWWATLCHKSISDALKKNYIVKCVSIRAEQDIESWQILHAFAPKLIFSPSKWQNIFYCKVVIFAVHSFSWILHKIQQARIWKPTKIFAKILDM